MIIVSDLLSFSLVSLTKINNTKRELIVLPETCFLDPEFFFRCNRFIVPLSSPNIECQNCMIIVSDLVQRILSARVILYCISLTINDLFFFVTSDESADEMEMAVIYNTF